MEGNLTRGPILKTLTKLAIPIMASSFLGTLYNITDMAWIGLLGAKAVAGVGVGGMFTWLSQGLASMARMGGQVQVAQCIGRGERQKAHGFAQTAMQLALLMGGCGNTESRVGLHQDCVRIHRFFVFVRNVNRNIYGTGRFQDAVCRKSFWFSGEYDSGSGFDSGTGTISEIWGCRSSDGDCFGSGNC